MKNKKNIYFLAFAVLAVWGVLGYRIFSTLSPNNEKTEIVVLPTNFTPQQTAATDNFTLSLNYRDPFLKSPVKKSYKKKPVNKMTITPKEAFPTIHYKGVVSAKNNKHQVFLITIDGQQHFFKKNIRQQGVTLVRGTTKNITLRFQGQQQTFQLEK